MMSTVKIEPGNAVEWATQYRGESFHALLCDPPYHLESIVKRFAKTGGADRQPGPGPYARHQRGFMGKTWDGGDIAFDPETWAAFLSIMYPGAFGMAFASSRGWHRLAVAIEDAGAIIHPSIFGWAYGSGFPKATRVNHGSKYFEGHRYGLQTLKPALEPIIVFQKPYEGKPVDCITETGAGTLNIDASRIETEKRPLRINNGKDNGNGWGNKGSGIAVGETDCGRWPANLILMDDEAAAHLDAQSGANCGAGGRASGPTLGQMGAHGIYNPANGERTDPPYYGDSGGASRFFFRVDDHLEYADPVRYCAKASRSERDAGCEEFTETQGSADYRPNDDSTAGIQSRLHGATVKGRNSHPTVKPLALAKYLATLLLPPAEYAPRRLFVPFAGVASEMIGAAQAGWDEITGVEITDEYLPIAQARIDYWAKQGVQMTMELG